MPDFLGVPINTLDQWRHKGTRPTAFRVGRFLRYDPDDVRDWLAERASFPSLLGDRFLSEVQPSTIQARLRTLTDLAPTYRKVAFANVSTVFTAAVDDELIPRNPCKSPSVRRQVKLFDGNRQVFALLKRRKTRTVPLPDAVAESTPHSWASPATR